MSGYSPTRFLTPLPPSLLCPICQLIFLNPLQCKTCLASFCEGCSKKAPLSCQHTFQKNNLLSTQISDLLIKCKFANRGCFEISKTAKIEEHETLKCYFSDKLCGRKECEEASGRNRVVHLEECGFGMVGCGKCGKEMMKQDLESHNCTEWLLSQIAHLSEKTELLKKQHILLERENKEMNERYDQEHIPLEKQIEQAKELNSNLIKEIEQFKKDADKEIEEKQGKSIDKMKIFHENAENRLKSLSNVTQFDFDQMSKRLSDHVKICSENIIENMSRLEAEKFEKNAKLNNNLINGSKSPISLKK